MSVFGIKNTVVQFHEKTMARAKQREELPGRAQCTWSCGTDRRRVSPPFHPEGRIQEVLTGGGGGPGFSQKCEVGSRHGADGARFPPIGGVWGASPEHF